MTDREYAILVAELRDDPLGRGYARMTDEQAAASLNETNRTRIVKRFVSWRGVATVLDDTEYAAVKTAVQQLAQSSERVADMLKMLELPCDESGTTGGLDFGCDQVRGMIDVLPGVDDAVKAKLRALGEETISRAAELGLPKLRPGHIESARLRMQQ